jgi:tetratricopeptide (TPR) repeat protein
MADLVNAFHGQGRLDSSTATTARAMALFDSIPPAAFADARGALRQMAHVLGYSRDWVAIDSVFGRLLATESAAAGPRSPPVARTYMEWALTLQRRGELGAADSLLSLALGIYRGTEGQALPAARVLMALADLAVQLDRPARAESLASGAVELYRDRLGDDHHLVAIARANHAALLGKVGRPEAAIPIYRLAIATYRRSPEAGAQLPVTEWRLAEALWLTGRLEDASTEFASALRGAEAAFPPGYIITAYVQRDYARVLLDLDRHREAVPMLRQALAAFEKRWGADDERTGEARELLARAEAAR